MDRRNTLIGLLAFGVASALPRKSAQAAAKAARVWRIGFLGQNTRQAAAPYVDEFLRGLREAGYSEGQDYTLEERDSDGRSERLAGLAAELVRLNVDVILAATTNAAGAAHKATATIPIVFMAVSDPVASGFAERLARPGYNMTGLSNFAVDLGPKRLELLRLALPKLSHTAFLVNPDNKLYASSVPRMRAAADAIGVRLSTVNWNGANEIDAAMNEVAREGATAIVLGGDPYHYEHRQQISAAAMKYRIALVSPFREYTEAGGLMSYGVNVKAQFHRAAAYVDKILKGSKPGELPIEQPAKFELVLNMKSAKALGLAPSAELLLRADELIQ